MKLNTRLVTKQDEELLLIWANDPVVRSNGFNTKKISKKKSSAKKNLKKKDDEPNKVGYRFNYALMLAVVSLGLLAIVFGTLYFIIFVEMKDLKSELNSKLSKNAFLSEKVRIKSSQTEVLKSEKEFLLSKINPMSNPHVTTNKIDITKRFINFRENVNFYKKICKNQKLF